MTARHRDGCRCRWCTLSRDAFAERVRAEMAAAAALVEPTGTLAEIRERITPHLREQRRTAVVTMISRATGHRDVIRLCEPECRDAFLIDLGMHGHGGGSAFRSTGSARVTVAWNATGYDVTWRRCPPSARDCDLCGGEWRDRPRPPSRPAPEPSPAQLAARARFAARVRSKGRKRPQTDVLEDRRT